MADTIDATGPQSVGGNPEAEGAEAVEIAQAGPTADAEPIGQVDSFEGTVTVTHADGTQEVLEAGSSVFQGDTLETGDGGAVGITLADETTFSMAENGSMVLDEMVYDPGTQEGSVSVSVLEGVFTFVSGQIAKTDPDAMTLDTPVATIGIRGTQVGLDIGEGGEMTVVLMEEEGRICRRSGGHQRRRRGRHEQRQPGHQRLEPGSAPVRDLRHGYEPARADLRRRPAPAHDGRKQREQLRA